MNNRSITVTLSADRDSVFAFLSRLENLPAWARAFCRELRRTPDGWRVRTPAGERYVALLADARSGVIDLLLGEQRDEMSLVPLRVVGQSHGAAVMGTFFQAAGDADGTFERASTALLGDLRGLSARFGPGRV